MVRTEDLERLARSIVFWVSGNQMARAVDRLREVVRPDAFDKPKRSRRMAKDWDGVSYGSGPGKAPPCVRVPCPECGAAAGKLCVGGKNNKGVSYVPHWARKDAYLEVVRNHV